MTSVVHFLFFTIVAAYAYKCNEEGCSINHTEDNSNFDQPRNEYLVLEDARSIKRPAPYGVVARPAQRMKISSKMEDGTRKENGSYKILNENPRNYPKISSRTGGAAEDRVVFPGPTSDTFVPVIPEECKRNGICEDVPNYPEEAVANLVASLSQEKRKFQIDQLDIPEIPDIAQRLGPQEENMELCSFREEIVYPKAAPDKDGIWHMIVNPKDKPVQGVRVEICTNDKSSCADFVKFERGYEARCVQKYFRRPMQCLDQSGGLVEKPLMLPSCCSCVARTV